MVEKLKKSLFFLIQYPNNISSNTYDHNIVMSTNNRYANIIYLDCFP